VFPDQEVFDVKTLLVLSEEDVKCIFDKAGPRASFIAQLNKLRTEPTQVSF
jgi:hypothetical protein